MRVRSLTEFTSAGGTVRSVRVLVVEDEVRMSRLLKRGLEEEGHVVDVVTSGNDGLWMATDNDYGAIILDVMLRGENGFGVCQKLREANVWTPVIMLTARGAPEDRVRGLDSGADDYLIKPFSFIELAARIRAVTRRDDRVRPVVLSVGDLQLDPSSRRVRRGEVEIGLTPKEFALLELFMRNPGAVLTRIKILDAAWDFAYDGTSNVIDQYVGYLRRKIDIPFGRNDLETVRGSGYRLRDPVND